MREDDALKEPNPLDPSVLGVCLMEIQNPDGRSGLIDVGASKGLETLVVLLRHNVDNDSAKATVGFS